MIFRTTKLFDLSVTIDNIIECSNFLTSHYFYAVKIYILWLSKVIYYIILYYIILYYIILYYIILYYVRTRHLIDVKIRQLIDVRIKQLSLLASDQTAFPRQYQMAH